MVVCRCGCGYWCRLDGTTEVTWTERKQPVPKMCANCEQADFAAKQPVRVDSSIGVRYANERTYVSMVCSSSERCVATEEGAATRWRLRP